MEAYSVMFYLFVILFGAYWMVADIKGPIIFKIISKIGSIYIVIFSILKFMKVL